MSSENFIAVIGDVHGCLYTLKALFEKLSPKARRFYSVGDIIDRGNHVSDTVCFCINRGILPVRGNHEEMLIKIIENHSGRFSRVHSGYSVDGYFKLGGKCTMKSYISKEEPENFKEFIEVFSKCGHLEYIKSFPLKCEFDKVVITHAGIVKGAPDYDILWNRDIPSDIGKLQVYGHTPVKEPEISDYRYINIDTGCVYGGSLTAAIIDTKEGEIKEIIKEKIKEEDYSDSLSRYFGF